MSEYFQGKGDKKNTEFFDEQIEQHLYWRNKVESFFTNPAKDNVLPSLISDDHHCQLGYWIHSSESQDYSNLTPFKKIQKVHTEFHQTADKVMVLIMEGEMNQAERLKQKFFELSDKIVDCLNQLKEQG